MTPIRSDVAVEARALQAVARTRALGLHFFGHFLGVSATESGAGRSTLVLDAAAAPGPGVASSPTEQATLADLALGSAIRSALGPGLRLGTTTLCVNHLVSPTSRRVEARATATWHDPDGLEGQGACRIADETGRVVATAEGWFVALPPPPGRPLPPVPWESPSASVPEDLTPDDLDARERASYDAVVAAAPDAAAHHRSVADQLTSPSAAGRTNVLRISPALSNRVGQVQGGALYGTAAHAAVHCLGPGWEVASGYVQYLRPVDAPCARVDASVLRRGRRVGFVDVTVTAADKPALAGRFTLRPAPTPAPR
ncbi:acyl-CoA thioesterase domain-containing protein [Micromonospora sp. NPDC005163]